MKLFSILSWLAQLRAQSCDTCHDTTYHVCSIEPFSKKLIWRGPFRHKDAMSLIAINSSCGSIDRLYEDVGGVMVPQ